MEYCLLVTEANLVMDVLLTPSMIVIYTLAELSATTCGRSR